MCSWTNVSVDPPGSDGVGMRLCSCPERVKAVGCLFLDISQSLAAASWKRGKPRVRGFLETNGEIVWRAIIHRNSPVTAEMCVLTPKSRSGWYGSHCNNQERKKRASQSRSHRIKWALKIKVAFFRSTMWSLRTYQAKEMVKTGETGVNLWMCEEFSHSHHTQVLSLSYLLDKILTDKEKADITRNVRE